MKKIDFRQHTTLSNIKPEQPLGYSCNMLKWMFNVLNKVR